MSSLVWASLDLRIIIETDDAFGFANGQHDDLLWLPKSQIESMEFDEGGDSADFDDQVGELVRAVRIPAWLARDKDLDWE